MSVLPATRTLQSVLQPIRATRTISEPAGASCRRGEGGMIAANVVTGDFVEALAAGSLFRLRGVLIGTVAFQTYSGMLGIRLHMAAILTGDEDIAQDYAVSCEVADSLPPILDLLQGIDPSFRAVPHQAPPSQSLGYPGVGIAVIRSGSMSTADCSPDQRLSAMAVMRNKLRLAL